MVIFPGMPISRPKGDDFWRPIRTMRVFQISGRAMRSKISGVFLSLLLVVGGAWANDDSESSNFEDQWNVDPKAALKEQAAAVHEDLNETLGNDTVLEDEAELRSALLESKTMDDAKMEGLQFKIEIEPAPIAMPPINSD